MTDYERLTDIFMDVLPEDNPFHGRVKNLVETLLANGVTFATDNNVGGNPVVPGHDDQYNIAEMAYNNGYAQGLEDGKPKWRPASEPPKEWKDENGDAINFLIFVPSIGIDIGNWIAPLKEWFCLGVPFRVTHWMELPEPPKEEGYE